ncbi:MAG: hypothetical protein ABI623_11125 [bacterium]
MRKIPVIYFFGLFVVTARVFSQDAKEIPTNFEVIRSLAKQIAIDALRQSKIESPGSIDLSVYPKETAWYVEGSVGEGFQSLGFNLRKDTAATIAATFGLSDARIEYSNVRKDGFFGSKLVDRLVEVQLTGKFTDKLNGNIVWSSDNKQSAIDTIVLSEINRIENPNIAITRGNLPREGFFSNFAEPLILLGAIAVAVFLLFSVRS